MNCLPDTGCSQSIISKQIASSIGATIDSSYTVQLYTASGSRMHVLGQCELQLSSSADHPKQSIKTFAIVVDSVSHPVLISWHDLQALKVIPKVFPASACSATSDSGLKNSLFDQYPEVFRDTLLPEPMICLLYTSDAADE